MNAFALKIRLAKGICLKIKFFISTRTSHKEMGFMLLSGEWVCAAVVALRTLKNKLRVCHNMHHIKVTTQSTRQQTKRRRKKNREKQIAC